MTQLLDGKIKDKTNVCVFDNVDKSIAVGNDVTFMSQDDCVQLNTLQWNQQWFNSTGCYSAGSYSYMKKARKEKIERQWKISELSKKKK